MSVNVQVCLFMHAHGRAKGWYQLLSIFIFLHLIFKSESLIKAEDHRIRSQILLDWLSHGLLGSSFLHTQHWNSRCVLLCLALCMGTGDLNTGLYTLKYFIYFVSPTPNLHTLKSVSPLILRSSTKYHLWNWPKIQITKPTLIWFNSIAFIDGIFTKFKMSHKLSWATGLGNIYSIEFLGK